MKRTLQARQDEPAKAITQNTFTRNSSACRTEHIHCIQKKAIIYNVVRGTIRHWRPTAHQEAAATCAALMLPQPISTAHSESQNATASTSMVARPYGPAARNCTPRRCRNQWQVKWYIAASRTVHAAGRGTKHASIWHRTQQARPLKCLFQHVLGRRI